MEQRANPSNQRLFRALCILMALGIALCAASIAWMLLRPQPSPQAFTNAQLVHLAQGPKEVHRHAAI